MARTLEAVAQISVAVDEPGVEGGRVPLLRGEEGVVLFVMMMARVVTGRGPGSNAVAGLEVQWSRWWQQLRWGPLQAREAGGVSGWYTSASMAACYPQSSPDHLRKFLSHLVTVF